MAKKIAKYNHTPLLLETIKISGGNAHHIEYHNDRFNRSQRELFGIDNPINLESYIVPPDKRVYRCRVLYDQEIRNIEYIPYHPRIIQNIAIIQSPIDYSYKYANRQEFKSLLSQHAKSDDLLITQNGYVTDTTIANVAFLDGKEWITPSKPLLEGTTRKRLIDEGFITPKSITIDDISRYDGFALMNAMIGFNIINPIFRKH